MSKYTRMTSSSAMTGVRRDSIRAIRMAETACLARVQSLYVLLPKVRRSNWPRLRQKFVASGSFFGVLAKRRNIKARGSDLGGRRPSFFASRRTEVVSGDIAFLLGVDRPWPDRARASARRQCRAVQLICHGGGAEMAPSWRVPLRRSPVVVVVD